MGRCVYSTFVRVRHNDHVNSIGPSLAFAANIVPQTDNVYSFGSATARWSTLYAATGTIQTSDARTKTDVAESVLGLEFINSLRPVSYKFKVGRNEVSNDTAVPIPGKRTHWGLIAQEVKQACDAAGVDFGGYIHDAETDQRGLRYDEFIGPIVKAVQELSAKVSDLESRILKN